MRNSTTVARTSSRFRNGPIENRDADVLRHSYAFTVWQTTIAANTIVESTAWSGPLWGRPSPGPHPMRTAAPRGSIAIERTASTAPRKANARRTVKRSSRRSVRDLGSACMTRSPAGSAPRATAFMRSVPMSSASICRTESMSGIVPPDSAQTTKGASSATLSVRW